MFSALAVIRFLYMAIGINIEILFYSYPKLLRHLFMAFIYLQGFSEDSHV